MNKGILWLKNMWGGEEAKNVARAYANIFNTPDGERVIKDMMAYCNVLHSSFAPGDAATTHFNEGQRDAFLHIMQMAGINVEDLMKTLKS